MTKPYTDSCPFKRTTQYHKMNDNVNMDCTIAGEVNNYSLLTTTTSKECKIYWLKNVYY